MATTVEQIHTALASAYPLIVVLSPEEDRIERLIQRFAAGAKPQPLPVTTWNCLDGFVGRPARWTRSPRCAGSSEGAARLLHLQGPARAAPGQPPAAAPPARHRRGDPQHRPLHLPARARVRGAGRAQAAHLRGDLAVPRRGRGHRDGGRGPAAGRPHPRGRDAATPDRLAARHVPARGRAPAAPPARPPPGRRRGVHGRGARREGADDAQGGDPRVRPPRPRDRRPRRPRPAQDLGAPARPACSPRRRSPRGCRGPRACC